MKKPEHIALKARHLGLTLRANGLAESKTKHKQATKPLLEAAKLADKLYKLTGDVRWKDTASEQRRKAERVKTRPAMKLAYVHI